MDFEYLLWLQNFRNATDGVFDKVFKFITSCGEETALIMIVTAVFWCMEKKQGWLSFLSFGLGILFNNLIKVTACVYRPWIRDARIEPIAKAGGYSFPSGHTARATAVYGSLSTSPKIGIALKIILISLILLIALSRNYIGVHTPQDVVVGFILAFLCVFGIKNLLEFAENNKNADLYILGGAALLSLVAVLYACFKSYPVDFDKAGKIIVDPKKMALGIYKDVAVVFTLFLSWFIERRYICFDTDGSFLVKIIRYVIGMAGYFLIRYLCKKYITGDCICFVVLKASLPYIYVCLFVPLCIRLVKNIQKTE